MSSRVAHCGQHPSTLTYPAGGDGRAMAGAAMGRARMLSESLATLETMLGVDLRQLSQNIASNIAARPTEGEPSPTKVATGDR